jgi:hypothetical protein
MKAGLSDVLLFCDSFLYVWSFFQQSYPISTYEAGLSDVLLFCDSFLLFGLIIFQQSYPISTYEAGIE